MTRGRIDPVPQRVLALRLRYAIDRRDAYASVSLVRDNPTSSRSSHVRHNLGRQRLEILEDYIAHSLPQAIPENEQRLLHGDR